jgi:hypothetical protein
MLVGTIQIKCHYNFQVFLINFSKVPIAQSAGWKSGGSLLCRVLSNWHWRRLLLG